MRSVQRDLDSIRRGRGAPLRARAVNDSEYGAGREVHTLPPALRWYLRATYVACFALIAGQLWLSFVGSSAATVSLPAVALFLFLTYLGERTYLQVTDSLSQSLSTTVHLAVILLFPPPYPMVITLLAVLVTQTVHEQKPLYKRAFNIGHSTLTVGLASALGAILATPRVLLEPDHIALALPIAAAYYILDTGTLAAVFALLEHRSIWRVWRQAYLPILLPELAACTIGVLAAVMWHYHPVLLALFVMPVVALHAAFRAIGEARTHAMALQRRSEQLEAVLAAGHLMRLQEKPAALLRPVAEAARMVVGAATAAAYLRSEVDPTILDRVVVTPPDAHMSGPAERPAPSSGEITSVEGAERVIQVPLEHDGAGVVGLVELTDISADVTQSDRDALAILATEAGIALENARLFKRTQEARYQAEAAVRVRDDFLTAASHDLRTPLTVISGHLQLLNIRLAGGRPIDARSLGHHVDTLSDATRRMLSTIEEITDAAQLQMGESLTLRAEEVDLGEIAQEVAGEAGLAGVKSETPPILVSVGEGALVTGDRARLERVVQNIVGNAVKYSPLGTPIHVDVQARDQWAVLVVRDRGIGIPPDELPHIFTHFYRASTSLGIPGTGIGLAGSKTIVQQHGGHIEIDSIIERGTTVTVRLPRLKQHSCGQPISAALQRHT